MGTELFYLSPQQSFGWNRWMKKTGQLPVFRVLFLLEGEADPAAVLARLKQLSARYEILRTSYETPQNYKTPFQAVRTEAALWLETEDLRACAAEERNSRLQRMAEEIPKNLDPLNGPVLGGRLVWFDERQHYLCLFGGGLSLDEASLIQIAQKILLGEPHGKTGGENEILQYADFAGWKAKFLSEDSPGVVDGKEFWARMAERVRAVPQPVLPLGIGRSGAKTCFRSVKALLPAHLFQNLTKAKTGEEASLLAAWLILLQKLTGREDVFTGVFCCGRGFPELEDALGLFARYLPLASQLDLGKTGRALVEQVGAFLEQVKKYEDCCDLEAFFTQARRDGYDCCFTYQRREPRVQEGRGLQVVDALTPLEPAVLELKCHADGGRVALQMVYDQSVCSDAQASLLLQYYQTLLAELMVCSERSARDLRLVSGPERERYSAAQQGTREPELLVAGSFQELFERQVERTPDRPAVEYFSEDPSAAKQQLSYRELNLAANQLAHYLQRRGVGPEVVVGICLHREVDLLVAIMGILKTGGAYLPLDPAYPVERLQFMLQDSDVSFLISTPLLADELISATMQTEYLHLPELPLAREQNENPRSAARPDNAAYLIYTSGSTGLPKATVVTQGGLVNYAQWSAREYRMSEGQGSLVHSSIAFDLTVTSLLSPLIVGQKVCLVPEGSGVDALLCCLRRQPDFSLVKITPAHMAMLNEHLRGDDIAGMARVFVIGGEALREETLAPWRERAPQSRLINEYGPTETVVGCCIYESRPDDPSSGPVPIGCPIANTEMYLLDHDLEQVPIGALGEIYIGGAGVARGYARRPEQTALRFVPHLFATQPGERLYRSGDLARRRIDGVLEFFGRVDDQVKINGFRIELGEIETQLQSCPGVGKAVVVVLGGNEMEKRLVAYISLNHQKPVTALDVSESLRAKLPAYMIPKVIVVLDQFPLNENGKIARDRLPGGGQATGDHVPPQTPTEEAVAAIWQDVLAGPKLGIHDDFFSVGGHSLHATRIISRVREHMKVDLPLRSLFEHSTIALFSQAIDQVRLKPNSAAVEERTSPNTVAAQDADSIAVGGGIAS
jgi:amino acid adenylation domain-containing protein